MKIIFILITFFLSSNLVGQDTIDMKEVYIDNDLVYRFSDNERFTGVAQSRRKNGHLVYEERYDDGIIREGLTYYNGKEKILDYKTVYHKYKLWVPKKEFYYPKSGKWIEITSFDENGKKILVEQFENDKLTYSCEYSGRKKHGKEFCYSDDGEELTFEYVNGKKKK